MKNSQALLNKLFTAGILLVIFVVFTLWFIDDPVSFYGNSAVYLLLSVGVGLLIPTALGLGISILVWLVDGKFGKPDENLPENIHFWTALILSIITGLAWAKKVIPYISKSDFLSVWPDESFRFLTVYEGYTSWGWVIAAAIFFAIGYAVYYFMPKKNLKK
jgi:hypothetical protein